MTNAEKFVEVFGTDLKRQYATKSWWDQEFVPPAKTGRWIKTISENGITSAVRCSKCGFEDNRYMLLRYCPNCGCRMVESQESEESCDNCKHNSDSWDSDACDGCCGANSKWSGEIYPGEFEAMEHNGRLDALESEEINREEIAELLARESEEQA